MCLGMLVETPQCHKDTLPVHLVFEHRTDMYLVDCGRSENNKTGSGLDHKQKDTQVLLWIPRLWWEILYRATSAQTHQTKLCVTPPSAHNRIITAKAAPWLPHLACSVCVGVCWEMSWRVSMQNEGEEYTEVSYTVLFCIQGGSGEGGWGLGI